MGAESSYSSGRRASSILDVENGLDPFGSLGLPRLRVRMRPSRTCLKGVVGLASGQAARRDFWDGVSAQRRRGSIDGGLRLMSGAASKSYASLGGGGEAERVCRVVVPLVAGVGASLESAREILGVRAPPTLELFPFRRRHADRLKNVGAAQQVVAAHHRLLSCRGLDRLAGRARCAS